ncbi:MAG TPA: zinc-binding alcohol dehydrogenase family protein [Acidimicrobiales bacterium]|nr:zinc-binding alcohol dehydrogenase family protein [Acidimicrobiales bacterium]
MPCRAARLVEHGKPLSVDQLELAEPGGDEVLVDMAYGGVNPVDRYGALGRVAPDVPLPRTLGSEGSGTVDGRPVMVRGHGLGTSRDGLWATQAVVPAEAIIDIPDGVEIGAAAAMGVAGVTAWRVVTEKAHVTREDRVLVLGASGGVGSIAVSVAHHLGATVWGQTTDKSKADWIAQRGADRVVVADASSLVQAAAELHPTVVIDPLGDGFTGAGVELLDQRGRVVLFGTSADASGTVPLQALYRKGLTVYGYGGLIEPDDVLAGHITDALNALRDGRLEAVIDQVVPLDRVNDAFELMAQRGVQGQLLLDLRS